MLWLALHLPLLSLEAFCATLAAERRDSSGARPVALVADHRVVAVDAAAAAQGVQPGSQRATALALAPDLLIGQADAARDAAALRAVAHGALAFTPAVTLEGGHTVLMEVQASLRYFGGLAALLARLRDSLAPLQHRVQIASAPTALGAAWLACWRADLAQGPHSTRLAALQACLDAAPVWLPGPGREHWQALQGMGLHTLSDLRQLPRSGLARRFGEGLLDDLDRAYGQRADPRRWIELPPVFESRLELFARADSTEQVLVAAAVLLARLVAWAQAQQARIAGFTLAMQHEQRLRHGALPPTELSVVLAQPSLDVAHLQMLLRERLAHCELAAPTLELRLHCRHLVRAAAPNGELVPTRQSEAEGLLRLLERLRARLGDEQVQRLVPVADHRPERATLTVGTAAAEDVKALTAFKAAAALAPSSLPLHRPVWLLPQPQPLAERGALPVLEGRALQLLSGPERVESGWWDSALGTRDYFIAQAQDGALVWVYRARVPAGDPAAGWYLHGRFG
jgi:protein ImuB